jgi:hypothetical protein
LNSSEQCFDGTVQSRPNAIDAGALPGRFQASAPAPLANPMTGTPGRSLIADASTIRLTGGCEYFSKSTSSENARPGIEDLNRIRARIDLRDQIIRRDARSRQMLKQPLEISADAASQTAVRAPDPVCRAPLIM